MNVSNSSTFCNEPNRPTLTTLRVISSSEPATSKHKRYTHRTLPLLYVCMCGAVSVSACEPWAIACHLCADHQVALRVQQPNWARVPPPPKHPGQRPKKHSLLMRKKTLRDHREGCESAAPPRHVRRTGRHSLTKTAQHEQKTTPPQGEGRPLTRTAGPWQQRLPP